jgi:putative hydrolase of the HAD superfamily
MPMIDLIGFDADDTLWENELYYRQAREEFNTLINDHLIADGRPESAAAELDDLVEATERRNLPFYGFGVMSFVLSLIETAVEVAGGGINSTDISRLLAIAKRMISAEVELFDQVEDVLADLYGSWPLVLITKGDLLHQRAKVDRSGIDRYFAAVEVVADKTPAVYASILKRHDISPENFIMVGNSMRSDILPVVDLGGRGVYVPNAGTWAYENVEPPEEANGHILHARTLADVPEVIRGLGMAR